MLNPRKAYVSQCLSDDFSGWRSAPNQEGLQFCRRHQSQCWRENGRNESVMPHGCSEKLKEKKVGTCFSLAGKDESGLAWNMTVTHSCLWLHTFKTAPRFCADSTGSRSKRLRAFPKSVSQRGCSTSFSYQNLSEKTMLFLTQIKQLSWRYLST